MSTLTPERWQEIEVLFNELMDLDPPHRDAFLEARCHDDPSLRAQLQRLLDADADASAFLGEPADAYAAQLLINDDTPSEANLEGRRIGPYRLEKEIGRGGMGTVYLAVRDDGQFQQKVALKLIGVGAHHLRERFLQERQILARLQHEGIARLLDGGLTEDAQPFFVMEYIEGKTVTAYATSLSLDERLRLFLQVCDAVQYAHRNLVVHRDLKPSNILVATNGKVKLLDFGIAKLLEDPVASTIETRLLTGTGQMLMTPSYASPEQVLGEAITTATDVYALGVLLFEMLTGERPYHFDRITPLEVARVVCEEAPTRPSSMVRNHTDSTEKTHPLAKRLKGDLDTIILKAMRKEPARRYGSVEAFAEDIRRYLGGLPVQARDDTLRYRSAKFIRRHRFGTGAAILVILLLVGFGILMTVQQAQTAREAQKAESVKDFLVSVFSVSDPGESLGEEVTARQLLEAGAERIESEMQDQPAVQAELMQVMGVVYKQLGLYDNARSLLEQSLEALVQHEGPQHPDVAVAHAELGLVLQLQGHYDEAEQHLRTALAIEQASSTDDLSLAMTLNDLALVLSSKGQFDTAEALYREALTLQRSLSPINESKLSSTLNNLGVTLERNRAFAEAEQVLREALTIRKSLHGDTHPDVALTLDNLASVLNRQGNYDEAEAQYREALAISRTVYGEQHPNISITLDNLATVLKRKGAYDEAAVLYREALTMDYEVLGEEHPIIATSLSNLAWVLALKGDYDEAESLHRQALAMDQKLLGEEHPDVAIDLRSLAWVLERKGAYDEAETLYRASLELNQRVLGEEHPRVSVNLSNLASLLERKGAYDEAEALHRQALAMDRKLLGNAHSDVALDLTYLASVLEKQGRLEEAKQLHLEALGIEREVLGEDHPFYITSLHNLGRVAHQQGDVAEAERLLQQALAQWNASPDTDPADLALTEQSLGSFYLDQGRLDTAEPLLENALARYEEKYGTSHPSIAEAQLALGLLRIHQQRFADAENVLLASHTFFAAAPAWHAASLSQSKEALRDLYQQWGKPAQALRFAP